MIWLVFASSLILLIGCRALTLVIHLLSGQHEINERLRLYAGR